MVVSQLRVSAVKGRKELTSATQFQVSDISNVYFPILKAGFNVPDLYPVIFEGFA